MSVSHIDNSATVVDFLKEANATNQIFSKEWVGHSSVKFKTEKMHVKALKTSEELNSAPHPMFSMGARRHFPD